MYAVVLIFPCGGQAKLKPERTSCIISNFDTRRKKEEETEDSFVSLENRKRKDCGGVCVCVVLCEWKKKREKCTVSVFLWFPVTPFIGLFLLGFQRSYTNCLYTISLERVSICAAVLSFFGFLFFLSGTLSSGKRGASSRHKTISWKKKLNANYAFPLNATADKEIHTNTDTRYIRLFFQLLFSQDSGSGVERWGQSIVSWSSPPSHFQKNI